MTHTPAPSAPDADDGTLRAVVGDPRGAVRILGRYALYGEIAAGGMATVHFGRLLGPVGFSRTVAIKRLHPQYAKDPEFVSMFLDEARLAARIRHPNVVPTIDVVATEGELFLVMEYVQGESLGRLVKTVDEEGARVPPHYASAIVAAALHGLHAAHEAADERGTPLQIIHRDVSPQNILVGLDGTPRVLDFGIAKAAGRLQTTRDGQLKGKIAYMSPEQLRVEKIDRRTDVYAAGVVLWEALTARRLFRGENDVATFGKVLTGDITPPSRVVGEIPPGLDAIVMRALSRAPDDRFPTAREMARALERAMPLVAAADIGDWVTRHAGKSLAARAEQVAEIESDRDNLAPARAQTVEEVRAIVHNAREVEPSDGERVRTSDVPTESTVPEPGAAGARATTGADTGSQVSVPFKARRRGAFVAFVAVGVAAVLGLVALLARPRDRAAAAEPPTPAASSTGSSALLATAPALAAPAASLAIVPPAYASSAVTVSSSASAARTPAAAAKPTASSTRILKLLDTRQ